MRVLTEGERERDGGYAGLYRAGEGYQCHPAVQRLPRQNHRILYHYVIRHPILLSRQYRFYTTFKQDNTTKKNYMTNDNINFNHSR